LWGKVQERRGAADDGRCAVSGGDEPDASAAEEGGKKKGGKKLLLLAVPVVLLAIVAGFWFSGILPGMHKKPTAADAAAKAEAHAKAPPVFLDVPELITNLNVPGRRQSYLKLHAKLELGGPEDVAAVTAAMPRILDLFQTYLRDMRPEELRGSEGSYRLREELIGRASVAVAPAHVEDVLFVEMIIQ
jgi:flagellar protein FliL